MGPSVTLEGVEPIVSWVRTRLPTVSRQGHFRSEPDVGVEPPWRLTSALTPQESSSGSRVNKGLKLEFYALYR